MANILEAQIPENRLNLLARLDIHRPDKVDSLRIQRRVDRESQDTQEVRVHENLQANQSLNQTSKEVNLMKDHFLNL